jgi:hypothetical protein
MANDKVSTLTRKIKALVVSITKQERRLHDDRVKIGTLLIQLRSCFGVENTKGTFRGSHKGTFCSHLEANGINVGSAYNWIALAEGRKPAAQEKTRNDMSKFITRLNKSETVAEKKKIISEVVTYLKKKYKVAGQRS